MDTKNTSGTMKPNNFNSISAAARLHRPRYRVKLRTA